MDFLISQWKQKRPKKNHSQYLELIEFLTDTENDFETNKKNHSYEIKKIIKIIILLI